MVAQSVSDSDRVWQLDRDHFIHPWTDFTSFRDTGSMVLGNGDGAHVSDASGRRYLDGIGGLWCVNIGYGRTEMAEAIAKQVTQIPYYSTFGHHTTRPAAELAAKLSQLAPGTLNHVFYGTGGSMANDSAVRMIHYYFNRLGKKSKKLLIARDDAYHGSTYMAMSLTGVKGDHIDFDVDKNLVARISSPNTYRRPTGTSEAEFCGSLVKELEKTILNLGPDNVAAFFAEPIMGAGGVIMPPADYHKKMAEVCRKYEVLYVSDEVVTAFGRLGHMFASYDEFGIQPDVITCAKGLTSGYLPLSATIISDAIYDVISAPRSDGALFTHGFTYSGHPVCCAAGLCNIDILERENICANAMEVGGYFQDQLSTLRELPLVGDVRGLRFMMCVESVANKESKELINPKARVGDRIADHCQKRGLLVRPLAHMNIMSPPLTLTKEDVDFLVSTLRESILETAEELGSEGYV